MQWLKSFMISYAVSTMHAIYLHNKGPKLKLCWRSEICKWAVQQSTQKPQSQTKQKGGLLHPFNVVRWWPFTDESAQAYLSWSFGELQVSCPFTVTSPFCSWHWEGGKVLSQYRLVAPLVRSPAKSMPSSLCDTYSSVQVRVHFWPLPLGLKIDASAALLWHQLQYPQCLKFFAHGCRRGSMDFHAIRLQANDVITSPSIQFWNGSTYNHFERLSSHTRARRMKLSCTQNPFSSSFDCVMQVGVSLGSSQAYKNLPAAMHLAEDCWILSWQRSLSLLAKT